MVWKHRYIECKYLVYPNCKVSCTLKGDICCYYCEKNNTCKNTCSYYVARRTVKEV